MIDPFEPELRVGRWQDVGSDIVADVLIFDAPYSEQTHASELEVRADTGLTEGLTPGYEHLTPEQVYEFVHAWKGRCRGWMVSITDDVLAPVWKAAYRDVGRYAFAAVPCVIRGMSCRMRGDGPSSWAVYAMTSRPKTEEFSSWGTLAGAYPGPRGQESGGGRGKPSWLTQALVRDYSRRGDLIVDPFCGWGSTLISARALGRRSIGIDLDADAISEARRRLGRPQQGVMFA